MDYHKLFLKIMDDLEENYSYLKYKKYSTKDIIKKWGHKFKKIKDDVTFIKILSKSVSVFNDPHVYIIDKEQDSNHKIRKIKFRKNYDSDLLFKKYFNNKFLRQNGAGVIGYYSDILYINFFTWNNKYKKEVKFLLKFIEQQINKKNPQKIIIDVRANHGGNSIFSGTLLHYFIPNNSKILIKKNIFRTDKKNPQETGKEKKTYQKKSSGVYSNAKVCILMGNRCMSSNEYMILGFNALKNKNKILSNKIFLIGDKTFGSSGNPKRFEYENRYQIAIPSWIQLFPNGEIFEGKGVTPGIYIKPKKSITRTKDLVFEKATEVLSR